MTTENISHWDDDSADRDEIVRRSLVAVHTMLAVDDGSFISSIDPPDDAAAAVASCSNEGSFPVLATEDDTVVLSSPIILYDHPAVAPESPGDLFDATEIDEILALRVLTLTEEEKAEARGTDARAAAVVDRVDDLPPEVWARLHGAVRSIEPVAPPAAEPLPWWEPAVDASFDPWSDTLTVDGVTVAKGSKVRLCPSRRADAHDMFLADQPATVAGVFYDVDGEQHVAVCLDDDPANEAELAGPLSLLPPRRDPASGGGDVKVLVAGIGNVFLGDDGFGVAVAERLEARPYPAGVRVVDFGIRGVHLAYELLDGWDALVLVDAMPMGERPGTVAVLDADLDHLGQGGENDSGSILDAHSMNPTVVLSTLAALGGSIDRVVVVGCQPATVEEGMGLSAPVAAAVGSAIEVVDDVVHQLCSTRRESAR